MKRIFSTSANKGLYHIALFIVRATVSVFMLVHGLQKLNMLLSGGPVKFPDPLGVGITNSLTLAVFSEVLCSIFIFIGLATRIVVFPLIITMFIIVFVVHGMEGFEVRELPSLYLLVYLFLLVTGSGKFSVDHFISRRDKYPVY